VTEQMERLVTRADVREAKREARTPVFISAAEVVFSTAAAVPLRTARVGWRTAMLAVQRTFAAAMSRERSQERRQPRHRPKRLRYLEDARMEREMSRL
jgi:hypothetical protein